MFIHIKHITAVIAIYLGVLIPLSSVAQVQTQRTSIEKHITMLKDKLKLNYEQTKKIKIIIEDQREELAIAINDNRSNSQTTDEAVKEITKNTDDKIKSILTEKQIEVYNKIIEEREARMNKQIKDGNK